MRALSLFFALFCFLALSSASPGQDVTKRVTSGSLQQVTNFGSNPSGTLMYIYVPNNLATKPGIVVAIHYCGWRMPQCNQRKPC
jgi:acetylxylan esterase